MEIQGKGGCPELKGTSSGRIFWSATAYGNDKAFDVNSDPGTVATGYLRPLSRQQNNDAFCR